MGHGSLQQKQKCSNGIMRTLKLASTFCAAVLAFTPIMFAKTGVTSILPDGREIHPAGNWISVAPYPFALAVRPDGAQIVVPSIGWPTALNVITEPTNANPTVNQMPAGRNNDPAIEVHAGLVYSPDGSLLYVATGDSGKVRVYRSSDMTPVGEATLDGPIAAYGQGAPKQKDFKSSFAATVVVSADGKTLYVLDQANWRVVIIDAAKLQRIAQAPTGTYPFGMAISPDGKKLYVTNTGLFEYTLIPGADQKNELGTGLHFPPFGFPSKAASEGAVAEGKKIPGLGDANSVRGSSLWTYDVRNSEHPVITAKLRLGARISEVVGRTVGGAAPTGIVADAKAVYVALSHDDALAKVSADGSRVLAQTELSPFTGVRFRDSRDRLLRGVMPSGLVLRDGRVYVAESGIAAVGVVDAATLQVVEHIPVGWNPSAVALSPDGKTLYAVNTKGKGTGPNAGKLHDPKQPTYIGSLELGSLSVITLADLPAGEELTQTVVAANTADSKDRTPMPRLKHCFLVIRENRTFDEVLGDVPGANGDPTLSRYGIDGWAAEDKSATHLKVTPNLHALAARYAMSDNFYVDSEVSSDGHRWVVGINPAPLFNTAWTSTYSGRRHSDIFANEPGRKAAYGGNDGPMPEDQPQFGAIWEHIVAEGKGVLDYGEGLELEGSDEINGSAPEGQRLFFNSPVPRPIFESVDRRYPTFNLGIPDQFRADEFERDFSRRLAKDTVPALIVIRLPGDHTMGIRPADGYPYHASYVADNDLALGRIVEYLSKTSIWKDSAMFVTEDDAQDGLDHVDAHRSILMVFSPWVKPGSVSHQHTSMGSITRTINELLGLKPMNLEDALAGQVTGIFNTKTDMKPFVALPSDKRVFDPAKARIAKPKTKEEAAALLDMDDSPAIQKELEKEKANNSLTKPKDND
jgi:YVTN family beta-propeller protein